MDDYDLLEHQRSIIREMVRIYRETSVSGFCFIPIYQERITMNKPSLAELPCSVGDLAMLEKQGLITLNRCKRGPFEVIEGSMNARAVTAVDDDFRCLGNSTRPISFGDTYNISQAALVGPSARAGDIRMNQGYIGALQHVDMRALASDLSKLRDALRKTATTADHDLAIGALAAAETAATQNDDSKVLKYLKDAGKWALDAATSIGTTVSAGAIQKAIGSGN